MADYQGRIRLTADTSDADRELDRFINRIDRVGPVRIAIANAGLRQAQQSFAQLQKSIGDLNKTPLNILTGRGAGSSSRSDSFRQLSQEAKDFFSSVAAGKKDLASTTAGLRQQADAFRNLADNINFTDQSQKRFFRSFTQGAEMARAKGTKASIEQLRALQDLYQGGITGLKEDVAPKAGGIQQLLSIGKDLPRTKAALSEYRIELERAFDLVETRSGAGGLIAVEISNVEKELLKIEQDRAEANNQINNVKKAGYALTRDQLSLEEENLALIERQADARRRAQQAVNDAYNRDRALSRDFGVNPAMALRPAGMSDEQVARRNLITDRTTAAAEASVFNAVSNVAAEIENDLPVLKSIERHRQKTEEAARREAAAAAKNANQVSAAGRSAEFRRTGGLSFEDRLARRRPDLAPGANARRQGFFRGSPRQAIGEGLIGGAFPLLFGQGLGASIGGAAGGVSGGLMGGSFGFGLSLIGTALGTAVDTTVQNLKDLAGALKSPTDAMAALEASGFRVGDSLKFQVEQLQAVGRGYDAQTLVLQEVQRRLGANGVRDLVALNAEQKKLQEQWSSIAGAIQGELLPALIGFTQVINGVTGAARGAAEDPIIGRILAIAGKSALAVLPGGPAVVAAAERAGALGRSTAARTPSNVRPARSPQEVLAAETTRIQESRRIADQIQSAYREAFKLQRQAYDLQREGADINREIADYSYRKEREIFDLRQQAAEKEIENNRAAAQNRIERGDLSARQTFAAATGFEQQLLTNVRESMRTRKEGEADIEQSRRRLELTMAKLNRDVEDYKRTNAREIEDIERRKLAYTRSVEDYKMQVADYVLQRSREAADLMRQAMAQGEVGGAGGGGAAPYAAVSPTQRIPFMSEIDKAAREANVDPRLFAGLVKQESAFRPGARSSSGAIGLAQLMPGTARELGVDPFNIQENLRGGARYLRQMLDRFGLEGGLRAYNQGPGAQERTPGGNSRESREYPGRVLANARAFGFNPAAMPAPATMAAGRYIQGGWGPRGPNQYGAHFDIARSDASYFERNALDRYVRVNGAPLSSGYTVPGPTGGRFGASRDGGTREHRAWDYAFGAGAALTLTGGAQWVSSSRGDYGDRTAFMTPDGKVYRIIHGKFEGSTSSAAQAAAATTISNIPQPRFNATPLGATPSAAPFNAERMAVLSRMVGSEQEAQRILEEQNNLRQKGVELGQIEQILQGNQLPQLEQQYSTLQMQIEARRQNLELSDEAASVADIQAESTARIAQLEKDRTNALAKAQKQFTAPQELQQATRQINEQANLAIDIARKEEDQRRKNLDLNNKLQNQERVRSEILQLQEGLAVEKAQAAALERGELQASNVELLKASTLYKDAEEAQQRKLLALTAETEELRKQNEFRQQINQLQQERRFTGAGLRAGMIGEPARRFEQALNEGRSIEQANQLAQEARLLENQQLIWANLEKNIVDVSDAISGALTNGLLDIVSGAREIEDVGRDMLNGIARTFADSAQQQLSTLLQRQIAQFAGPRLAEMIGGGAQQATGAAAGIAGVQALGSASFAASGQVAAFGVALQTVMGQMAFSGIAGGLGSAAGGIGSAFSSAAPNLFPALSPLPSFNFGGFLANGGTTRPGEGYIVGEKEPEFFFPGASGRVVPKSDMEKAAALAEEGADNDPIDIRYTVTEQAGERYVTEDQFRKGMAATSKRAQAMAYAGMRNNKEVRDYTGIG